MGCAESPTNIALSSGSIGTHDDMPAGDRIPWGQIAISKVTIFDELRFVSSDERVVQKI